MYFDVIVPRWWCTIGSSLGRAYVLLLSLYHGGFCEGEQLYVVLSHGL